MTDNLKQLFDERCESMPYDSVLTELFSCVNTNELFLSDLTKYIEQKLVVPFIGAGLSFPVYPIWRQFFSDVLELDTICPDGKKEIKTLLYENKYEQAATILEKSLGKAGYISVIKRTFSEDKISDSNLNDMAISILPFIFNNNRVITTNFDRLLNYVFQKAGYPFKDYVTPYSDSEVAKGDFLLGINNYLLKLHGDYLHTDKIVFTEDQYNVCYGENLDSQYISFLTDSLSSKVLLFLGCSLDIDRTTLLLDKIALSKSRTHYALIEMPSNTKEQAFYEKNKRLSDMGINCIWYPKGKHECVKAVLFELKKNLPSATLDSAISQVKLTQSNEVNLKWRIWEATKHDYLSSKNEGGRFANLNILSGLLPHGYIIHTDFIEYGKTENGDVKPLLDILDEYATNNIAVIGEGGIGKTTFLLRMMEEAYSIPFKEKAAVPVFIELNRCPAQIGSWHSASNNKTNFITRYIASQISSCELEDTPSDVLAFVENEFKKCGKNKRADYIILLDGFNEVNRGGAVGKDGSPIGSSIREMLNKEIKALMSYPNVRVITTSRKTDMAFFHEMAINVELTGVRKINIEAHLHENNYSQWDTNQITASRKLMDCLRIPLFLCMFTATGLKDGKAGHGAYRPLTRGEILYCFFNRSQGIYNERLNAERLNPTSSFDKKQMLFILDFVLPYIGWTLEYTDFFSIEREDLLKLLDDFFNGDDEDVTFWNKNAIVFHDYESEMVSLGDFKDAIMSKGFNAVLDCIVNTLGAMYRDQRFEYSFVHHHVRDYFAGIYEIQRMRMAEAFYGRYLKDKRKQRIDSAYSALSLVNANLWSETKRVFIGEILCEHKNSPEPDETGKWGFPAIVCPEQNTLRTILDVFRHAQMPIYCGVLNVVETMKAVRGNLAGEDFSRLSLVECRLHGVNCSIGRGKNNLAANFQNTKLSDDVFETEGHTDDIQYFVYSKHADYLFTMSNDNIVKRWETDTGHCVNTIKIECSDMVESDQLTQTHFAPSYDGESFLTSGFTPLKDSSGHLCFVQQYDWKNRRIVYESGEDFHDINTISYSVDDKFIAVVYSHNNLRIYKRDIAKPIFGAKLDGVGNVIEALILKIGQVLLFYTYGNEWWHEQDEGVEDDDIEEIIYRIALFDTKAATLEVLHEYSAEIDMNDDDAIAEAFSPLYTVDSNGDIVMFFEDETLKKLDIQSKSVVEMPFNYGEPDFITFAPNTKVLFALYYEECVRYDVAQGCEIGLYHYDGLNYQISGKHSALSLLMFDDELDSYERNLVTDTLTPKYKKSKHSIVDIFMNANSTELIVTFDNDSLWVIDEQSGSLLETMCFSEPDAKSCLSLYSAASGRMVFLFENDNYEYIKCYNLTAGKSERAYFDFVDKHKIKEIFMPESEDCLFCVFEKSVDEINLTTLKLTEVYQAEESEVIQAAYYCNTDNCVRIISSFIPDAGTPARKPRASEMRKDENVGYRRISWYELPYLEKKILRYMSVFYKEVFTQPQTTDDKFKLNHEFFISSGVILDYDEEYDDDIAAAMRVDKHIFGNDGSECIENVALNPLEVNYVIGDLPVILTRMNYEGNNCEGEISMSYQLLDVSEDKQTIVAIISDGLIVFQFFDGCFHEVCRFSPELENLFDDSGVSGARIGRGAFVYYWIGANSLHRLDTREGENKKYEEYTPGLSVMGCDFRDADMSTVNRFMLALHGGVTM